MTFKRIRDLCQDLKDSNGLMLLSEEPNQELRSLGAVYRREDPGGGFHGPHGRRMKPRPQGLRPWQPQAGMTQAIQIR
jgi:hypothetical protein